MLKETIKGKDVIILHNKITDTYTVVYEGNIIKTNERPTTDQDIWEFERQKEAEMSRVMGLVLVDLLLPILN